jgi:hypothetical protein
LSTERASHFLLAAAFAVAAVLPAGPARGEVQIIEGEVVFSIRAPGAKDVFLVGDFNNWNPTLEKMEEVEDRFEVALFLLPGKYRYKFVVDGVWTSDPENPPADPAAGSLLELQERAGTLVFGDGEEGEKEAEEGLKPSVRYVGAFFLDERKTNANQALDVWVSREGKTVDAKVDFKTTGDSWGASPLRAEVFFDRGTLDVKMAGGSVRAFENDSIWVSSDPFHLVGRVGVYDYSAGYGRHGVAVEMPLFLKTSVRALFCDRIEGRSGPPPVIDAMEVEDFAGSQGPDTTLYQYENVFEDEDTWALEFVADAGSLDLGYVMRWNRGMHPGLLADVEKVGANIEASVHSSREFWEADAAWMRYELLPGLAAAAGVGWASAEIRTTAKSTRVFGDPGDLAIGQVTSASDRRIPIQTSTRWRGGLEFESKRLGVSGEYARSEYEFEEGVYPSSTAKSNQISVGASYSTTRWRAEASFAYFEQNYGATPDDFHAFTPSRNFWIDDRDRLTISNMVAFDLERSATLEASLRWNEEALSNPLTAGVGRSVAAALSAGATSKRLLETVEYAYARLSVDLLLPGHTFAGWDTRVARYDKETWGLDGTFLSTYLEGGYRREWLEVSLGIGLDPVVLDPVVNEYRDIGREEYLRRAIPPDPARSDSASLGEGLRRREESLESYHPLKLELVLSF